MTLLPASRARRILGISMMTRLATARADERADALRASMRAWDFRCARQARRPGITGRRQADIRSETESCHRCWLSSLSASIPPQAAKWRLRKSGDAAARRSRMREQNGRFTRSRARRPIFARDKPASRYSLGRKPLKRPAHTFRFAIDMSPKKQASATTRPTCDAPPPGRSADAASATARRRRTCREGFLVGFSASFCQPDEAQYRYSKMRYSGAC